MLKGFRDFIARGNVLDLAVGVIIGVAFGAIVDSLVKDLITPIIGLAGRNARLLRAEARPDQHRQLPERLDRVSDQGRRPLLPDHPAVQPIREAARAAAASCRRHPSCTSRRSATCSRSVPHEIRAGGGGSFAPGARGLHEPDAASAAGPPRGADAASDTGRRPDGDPGSRALADAGPSAAGPRFSPAP